MHRAGHMLLYCFYYGFNEWELFFPFRSGPGSYGKLTSHRTGNSVPPEEQDAACLTGYETDGFECDFPRDQRCERGNMANWRGQPDLGILVSFKKVLEISIPFTALACGMDDRLDSS